MDFISISMMLHTVAFKGIHRMLIHLLSHSYAVKIDALVFLDKSKGIGTRSHNFPLNHNKSTITKHHNNIKSIRNGHTLFFVFARFNI